MVGARLVEGEHLEAELDLALRLARAAVEEDVVLGRVGLEAAEEQILDVDHGRPDQVVAADRVLVPHFAPHHVVAREPRPHLERL